MKNKKTIIIIIFLIAVMLSFSIGLVVSPHRQTVDCTHINNNQEESLQITWTDKEGNLIIDDPNFELNKAEYFITFKLKAEVTNRYDKIIKTIDRYGIAYVNKQDKLELKWRIKIINDTSD